MGVAWRLRVVTQMAGSARPLLRKRGGLAGGAGARSRRRGCWVVLRFEAET